MLSRVAILSLLTVTLRPACAIFVDYDFDVRNVNVFPDGFERSIVSVNGIVPGTLVQANKNDTLRINVTNSLTDPSMRRATSIHWHGLFQHTAAYEDGPAFVTQCPISQFNSYTYEIPLREQTGTFWYHAHLSSQYVDGLRGALVIYDPEDPHKDLYDVDDENTVIMLEDWYHTPAPLLEQWMFSLNNTLRLSPVPDSGLINGRGRYVNGPRVKRSVINVTQGKRYRLRIINASAIGSFIFSIEGHRLAVIEADGISHEPLVVDSFQIFAGQRYSVVLEANQTVANYWTRAPMTVAGAGTNPNLDPTDVFAVLHYDGAPDAEPTTEQGTAIGTALVEEELHALESGPPGGSDPADVSINLAIGRSPTGPLQFTFNNIKYESPSLPTLLKILAKNATTDDDFNITEHTLVLPHNKVIELNITGGADHPIHLHGHAVDVIKSLGGTPNFVNPPRRDVVRVGGAGVLLRFRTDNPGPWFVHCHIDWHLEAGLALVFAEAPEEQRTGPQAVRPNQAWKQLCPKYQALPPELQ